LNKKKIYQNVIFFDDRLSIRIQEEEKKKIERIFKKNQEIFMNESHVIRSAIVKFLREYDRGGKKLK
jgi:Arc/MetJ-type ribon-helix-helix transcriptional regulator